MKLTRRQWQLNELHNRPLDTPGSAIPEKRKIKNRPEDDLQKACVEWLRIRRKRGDMRFIACNPDPMKKTFQQRSRALALGVESGPPDLVIFLYDHTFARRKAIFCELKAPKGALSDSQKDWREWLSSHGWEWHLVRDLNELIGIVGP